MTISTADLKIFKAQRNRDTADGGGAMSPNEVIDGEINNVFDDISSEDRVGGRVSIRKIFPGVFSDDTERFFGAGLFIISPAIDEAVDVLLTRNTRYDDERADVVNRIESFLVPGRSTLWRLFNTHLQGTAQLSLYAPSDAPSPDLGDTLFLEDEAEVQDTEAVRIQQIVSRQEQTFFDASGAFQRDVLVLQLSRPLQADWQGQNVQRNTVGSFFTRIRNSTVSAGAKYFGVKPLTEDVAQGDLTAKVDNPFSRVVPSTNAENPVTDERATLSGVSFTAVGDPGAISVNTGTFYVDAGVADTVHLGGTVLPGSVEISGSFTGTDNGNGTIETTGSSLSVTADYETGAITVLSNSNASFNLTLVATPAAAVQDSTLTVQVAVLPQTRRLNYIRTVRPLPAPGTINVDYRALDNWFRLSDDGNGSLSGGQPGEGGGTVNYATGTISATLSALPDVGTSIIISWGTPKIISEGTSTIPVNRPHFQFQIADAPFKPGSLNFSYPSDGNTISITSDKNGKIFDGSDEVGIYVPSNGTVAFRPMPGRWPDPAAQLDYTVDLDQGKQELLQPTPSGASDQVTFTLPDAPLEPGSITLTWPVEAGVNDRLHTIGMRAFDDGNGAFVYANGGAIPGSAINYTTGEVSFQAAIQVA